MASSWKCYVAHKWGDWVPIAPNSCYERQYCQRCGCERQPIYQRTRASHQFGEWMPSSSPCRFVRVCKRGCGEEEIEDRHHFTEWACTKCGEWSPKTLSGWCSCGSLTCHMCVEQASGLWPPSENTLYLGIQEQVDASSIVQRTAINVSRNATE